MKLSIRIPNIQYIVLIALVLIYMPATYLLTMVSTYLIYNYARMIISVFIIIFWCFGKRKSIIWIGIVGMIYILLALVTFIYHGPYLDAITNMYFSVAFCMLIDHYLHKSYVKSIVSMRIAMEILVIINFVTVLLFPQGLYTIVGEGGYENAGYFLGHRNNAIEVLIPALGIAILESYIKEKKINLNCIFLLTISAITVIVSWSANSILCIFVFVIYIVFFFKLPHIKFFHAAVFAAGSAIITVLLIVFRIQEKMVWLIVDILKKDMTLTSRSVVWKRSLKYIQEHFLLGNGIEENMVKLSKIGHVNSCHNYFLDFLYYGGVVLLLVIIILFIFTLRKMYRSTDEKLSEVIAIVMGAYAVLWIATPVHRESLCWMFGFWLIAYHSPIVLEKKEECKRKNL